MCVSHLVVLCNHPVLVGTLHGKLITHRLQLVVRVFGAFFFFDVTLSGHCIKALGVRPLHLLHLNAMHAREQAEWHRHRCRVSRFGVSRTRADTGKMTSMASACPKNRTQHNGCVQRNRTIATTVKRKGSTEHLHESTAVSTHLQVPLVQHVESLLVLCLHISQLSTQLFALLSCDRRRFGSFKQLRVITKTTKSKPRPRAGMSHLQPIANSYRVQP
jgi:hypothetical protein